MSTNDPNPPSDTPASNGFSAGQTLAGCYGLLHRVGAGDAGEIWLANDEVLGKEVTLHFLPATVAKDSRALQELRQDVKRCRQLIHAHVLRVYDLIEEPEWAAISMNAFEGESVAARAATHAGKGFAATEIEPWFFQLVQTIEDAHKINFLHRDLAPHNLFLTAAGQVLVTNFGIGRTVQDALTRAGAADEARNAFASPQTLAGTAPERTDDVYSLGAVLYAMLAGTPPAAGADAAALETLGAPPAWRKAIAASLQKSPADRPQTAGEFLKILKGEASAPVTAASVAAPVPVEVPKPETTAEPAAMEPVPSVEKVPEPVKAEEEKTAPVETPKQEVESIESKAPGPLPKTQEPEPKTEPKPEPKAEPKAERKPEPKPAPKPTPEPKRKLERPSVGDFKPRLYPEESRFPIVPVGVVAVLLLAAIIWYFSTSGKKASSPVVVNNETPAAVTPAPTPEKEKLPSVTGTPEPPKVVINERPPKATLAPQTPSPAGKPTPSPEEKAIADKLAALDKTKQSAQLAEKSHADLAKQQQQADAALADAQKIVEEKAKAADMIGKAASEAAAQQKKLEDDQKAAEAAAQEAQRRSPRRRRGWLKKEKRRPPTSRRRKRTNKPPKRKRRQNWRRCKRAWRKSRRPQPTPPRPLRMRIRRARNKWPR